MATIGEVITLLMKIYEFLSKIIGDYFNKEEDAEA